MTRQLISILLLATLLSFVTPVQIAESATTTVRLVVNSDNRSVSRIAAALRASLDASGIASSAHDVAELDRLSIDQNDLLVSVGNASSRHVAELKLKNPQLSIGTRLYGNTNDRHAHLNIAQPLCRQLALIDKLSDDIHSVSIISSVIPKVSQRDQKLKKCSSRLGISIVTLTKKDNETVNAVVRRALVSDAVLAVPDPEIYNRVNIKNVLLLSYRKRIPVIGFSEPFVKAGALAALHSTPEIIARQTLSILEHRLGTGRFAATLFQPDDYEISTNRYVSKSLGIKLPDDQDLRDTINRELDHE